MFLTGYRHFEGNGNIIVQLVVMDTTINNGYYYILQEYNTEGRLLSQTNIFDDKSSKIHYITFDNENNYLVIFRKSKILWAMERRKWL